MRRRRSVDEWMDAVTRASRVSSSTQVLLLHLGRHMRADRTVSIPRCDLADALGISERRITERITKAHEVGFLATKSPGYRGHTAVYEGLFPSGTATSPLSGESGTHTSPLSVPESVPLSMRERGTHGGPTTSTANLSPFLTDRNVG